MSVPTKPNPNAPREWTTFQRTRLALWIAVKLAIIVLLARTDALQFVYKGF